MFFGKKKRVKGEFSPSNPAAEMRTSGGGPGPGQYADAKWKREKYHDPSGTAKKLKTSASMRWATF